MRQYVLSVPFELRLLLARDATAYGAVTRIFAEEVMRSQRARARERGVAGAMSAGVSVQQRWGSSINLNPHVHAAWCDGVFIEGTGGPQDGSVTSAQFHPLPAPTPEDLFGVVLRIHERTVRWLRRRGLLADPEIAGWSNLAEERSSLDACLASALGLGQLGRADARQIAEGTASAETDTDEERFERLRRGPLVADALGWSLHAGTTVAAWDRVGLETLLRYFTRPPLAQRRLVLLRDGRVAYALRKPWRRDQTHRLMTPLELIARLAAVIPAPRRPLLRFHGAFAPHSRWRRSVVPRSPPCPRTPPWQCATQEVSPRSGGDPPARRAGEAGRAGSPSPTGNLAVPASRTEPDGAPDRRRGTRTPPGGLPASPAEYRDGPRLSRIDWATLLWRVHDVDALACECGARLRFIDLFADAVRAQAELEALGLGGPDTPRPDSARPSSRARDPTVQDDALDWP